MSCPYRKEIQMVFCRAYPVKKPVPIDRVTTSSTCDGTSFEHCPLFRDAVAEAERSGRTSSEPSSEPSSVSSEPAVRKKGAGS